MTAMQKRPRALFSPGRSLPGETPGLRQAKGLFGAQEWVIPRRDCQYRKQDFRALPPRKRPMAARLAAARFLPSADARIHLAWQEGIAHYWIWTPPQDSPSVYRRWLPESLLYPPPTQEGVRLLSLCEGVEGQYWSNGVLAASQWWAHRPSEAEWLTFLRAAGASTGGGELPEPVALAWLDRPWAHAGGGLSMDADTAERVAWMASAGLLLAVSGWQLASLMRWDAEAAKEAVRLEVARSRAAPLQAARERAEAAAAQIADLRELEPEYTDYDWMARIGAKLPNGASLAGWSREPGKLRVLVRGGDADPRRYIEAFVQSPPFDDLTATVSGSGNILLEFALPQPRVTEGSDE